MLISEVVTQEPSPHQKIILQEILTMGWSSHGRLMDQIWGQDPTGGPLDAKTVIRVQVSRLNKKMLPGLEIRSEHIGKGPNYGIYRQPVICRLRSENGVNS